ncbi:trans-2,3-dihydro-3-hydroxyanthranilate isomerase [Yoonia tamlensis]|uniref:Trans-2,3-dihydro-3-hydroxyanthranilate isomerase n=1 Tax=Yoonia tamlensis TaxID=390270 RepID=A0A1I6G6H1_9RHOB|nr:PhzF family phenazine biosynthesis protein [Yoonia tamlensis]SFR37782.1 trans-2,3-dihydro-3-hydroxyanthranilate isomerase [Yoonia tamlensis]
MTAYLVYDVFTKTRFGGNQLAVIPDARALPEDDLQQIAREFNFSETTFVYPPENPAHTAKVRIFTPTMEVAFAGHPTIGTAIALRDQGHSGDMVLELGVGPIPCSFDGDVASFVTSAPLERISKPDTGLVAAALGLPATAIDTAIHAPVQASLGLPFVIVALDSAASLSACAPQLDAFRKGARAHPAGLDFAIYAYVRDGDQIDARMFAPLDDIPEDPATGSAAATLAGLLTQELDMPQNLTIQQGVDMGRPSLIMAATKNQRPVPITISGTALRMMEGRLVT